MRFAAVSDIHGNLPALDAVISDIAARGVSEVVNLGDCLSGPLWPVETAQRLMELDWPTLAGNHERQLLTQSIAEMGITDAGTAVKLTPAIRDWMRKLPAKLEYSTGVLLCHGTPTDDHRYWLHRGRRGSMREATIAEIEREDAGFPLTLCGHTHLPRAVKLHGGRMIANPGSVGLPAYEDDLPSYHVVETGTPHARYLIAERTEAGWSVELHAVEYEFERAALKAERAGRPTWAYALRKGRVMAPGLPVR